MGEVYCALSPEWRYFGINAGMTTMRTMATIAAMVTRRQKETPETAMNLRYKSLIGYRLNNQLDNPEGRRSTWRWTSVIGSSPIAMLIEESTKEYWHHVSCSDRRVLRSSVLSNLMRRLSEHRILFLSFKDGSRVVHVFKLSCCYLRIRVDYSWTGANKHNLRAVSDASLPFTLKWRSTLTAWNIFPILPHFIQTWTTSTFPYSSSDAFLSKRLFSKWIPNCRTRSRWIQLPQSLVLVFYFGSVSRGWRPFLKSNHLYQFNSSILRQGHSISTNKRTDLTQFHQSHSPHSDRKVSLEKISPQNFCTTFLTILIGARGFDAR